MEQPIVPTTYQNWYKDSIEHYKQECLEEIGKAYTYSPTPSSISECVLLYDKNKSYIPKVDNIIFPDFKDNILSRIKKEYERLLIDYREKVSNLKMEYEVSSDSISKEYESFLISKRKDIENELSENDKKVIVLKVKKEELDKLAIELESIFHMYNLPLNDYEIHTEDMSIEEILELIKVCEYSANRVLLKGTLGERIFSIFYKPVDLTFKSEDEEFIVKSASFVGLVILCILLKPYFLGIASLVYMISILSNLFRIKEKEKYLKMVMALVQDIDLTRFIETDVVRKLRENLEEAMSKPPTDDLNNVNEELSKKLNELEKSNPKLAMEKDLMTYTSYTASDEYLSIHANTLYKIREKKEVVLQTILDQQEVIRNIMCKSREGLKFLGTDIVNSQVMSYNAKMGVINFEGTPVCEYELPILNNNIIFYYKDIIELSELTDYLKLLMINMLANVKENVLSIKILDKENLGRDFVELMEDCTDKILQVESKEDVKIVEDLMIEGKSRVRKMGKRSIEEYNSYAVDNGILTIPYKLLVIYTTGSKLYKNEAFKAFLQYSASIGLHIFYVVYEEPTLQTKEREELNSFLSGKMICTGYGKLRDSNRNVIDLFEYPVEHYKYTHDMGRSMISTVESVLKDKNRQAPVFLYEEEFRKKYIPDHAIWSKNTLKGIEINFGLEEGDPNKPFSYLLGDDTVHLLMGGATGSGKSAAINQILANVLYNYPPEWLELVMVDFKIAEFAKYAEVINPTLEVSRCPHAKILAGTEDGGYAVSIFNYLLKEMKRRQKKFSVYKVSKIEEFNLRVMDGTIKNESILPRILCVIDEFQTMFTTVDDKSLDIIKTAIKNLSKLARAMGLHLWFVSQSMSSTMPQDILDQFKLRAALSSSVEASKQLIGNDDAAIKISGKGWIYVNDTTGTISARNKIWRVPFISDDETSNMLSRLTSLTDKRKSLNRKAKFFREDNLIPYTDLEKIYETSKTAKDPSLFLLGDKLEYSEEESPHHFSFIKDDNEHAFVSALDTPALLNLTETILTNINCSNGNVILNCADKLLLDGLNLSGKIDKRYESFIPRLEDVREFLEMIKEAVEGRSSNPNTEPMYIMCVGWDKYEEFGQESRDYRTPALLKEVVKISSRQHVHFIFITKEPKIFSSIRPMLLHKIGAFMEEAKSNAFSDTNLYYKTTKTKGIYMNPEVTKKFKVYQYPREVKEEILVL